jgi:hypothetical protein
MAGVAAAFGAERVAAARRHVESSAALPLLFPHVELGTRYAYPPTPPDATSQRDGSAWPPPPPPPPPPPLPRVSDGVAQYEPTTAAGARLPHCWLVRAADGARCSTHDALALAAARALPTLPSLSLIVDSDAARHWARARTALPAARRALVRLVVVCADDAAAARAHAARGGGGDAPGDAGDDVSGDEVFVDAFGAWRAVRGVGTRGAVLVRPDGHVAWRTEPPQGDDTCDGDGDGDFDRLLADAVAATLSRGGRAAARQ